MTEEQLIEIASRYSIQSPILIAVIKLAVNKALEEAAEKATIMGIHENNVNTFIVNKDSIKKLKIP